MYLEMMRRVSERVRQLAAAAGGRNVMISRSTSCASAIVRPVGKEKAVSRIASATSAESGSIGTAAADIVTHGNHG